MIYINFLFNHSSGGGNSFLNRLKVALKERKYYSSLFESKVIIFNSHHRLIYTLILKLLFSQKYFIHRVDGPMSLYTGKLDKRDKLVYIINQIADFTIFQSQFSYSQQNKFFNLKKNQFSIIHNGTKIDKCIKKKNTKKKIIIASWSKNINKGFEIFNYLDNNIDRSTYDIDFFGNSPFSFKNINLKGAVNYQNLERELDNYDLAIIASKNDPCSNFLIECINKKLDILALNSGGHRELIKNNSCLFDTQYELVDKLTNYKIGNYKNILRYDIYDITTKYIYFCKRTIKSRLPRKVKLLNFFSIIASIILIKLKYK